MEMPIPVGKATLRALDNIIAAKRVLQGDVPSRRCTRSGLPGPTLLPRGTRAGGASCGPAAAPEFAVARRRDGRDDRKQATVVVASGRLRVRAPSNRLLAVVARLDLGCSRHRR